MPTCTLPRDWCSAHLNNRLYGTTRFPKTHPYLQLAGAMGYLRRQLFVLDTYPNVGVRLLNHGMLLLYSYAALGIFAPFFLILLYCAQMASYAAACIYQAFSASATVTDGMLPQISTLRPSVRVAFLSQRW